MDHPATDIERFVFSLLIRISTMPHKFNADRRDKIAKQKYQVTNWPGVRVLNRMTEFGRPKFERVA
ncbi:hypothetical protein CN238_34140 [Sinorhizobium meliloti]|nr:hypothetical protein CN238_34140 [Sinorhizobium meliloti]RVH24031.1 hypothetical protein CN214_26310 [Sinorhizobium meliloti]